MVKEKDVLVAEVFHRVKNNMNIVTSLLNLKKNSSDSDEVRDALQDCRNRVFSMALVHKRIFQKNDVSSLDFGEYVHDLADEIIASLGLDEDDSISVASDEMELPISQAIPCGLIVNEVITNSCKHARIPGQPLKIKVELKSEGGKNVIRISDNGPGADENSLQRTGSLGIDLIKSLCQQIDSNYRFEKKDGMLFEMSFV
jgi:two-component sensor histidine kinase